MTEKTSDEDKGLFSFGALKDLLIVMAVLVIVKQSVLPYSFLYAGPASTLSAMAVGTLLLYRRGLGWKDLGLRWPESWIKTAGLTVLTMFLFIVTVKTMGLVAGHFFEDVGARAKTHNHHMMAAARWMLPRKLVASLS